MDINIYKNTIRCIFLIIMFQSSYLSNAQKKYVTEKDYEKWTTMSSSNLSSDGKWSTYQISNTHIKGMDQPENPRDTLELTEIKTLKKHAFSFGYNAQFTQDSQYLCFLQKQQLVLFDLQKHKENRLDSISSYELALDDKLIIYQIQNNHNSNQLRIMHIKSKEIQNISQVVSYKLSPDKNFIFVVQRTNNQNQLLLYNLNILNSPITLLKNTNNATQFTWSNSGNKLAFYQQNPTSLDYELYCLNVEKPGESSKITSLDLDQRYQLKSAPITFNKTDDKINLTIFPIDDQPKVIDPLIWRSSDPVQPPQEIIYPKRGLATWNLSNKFINYITDQEQVIASGDLNHFFILSEQKYLPSFKFDNQYCDIVFYNSNTGESKIIQEKFINENRKDVLSVSPEGKYFAWLLDKNWWVYDIVKDQKYCITCDINDQFAIDFDHSNVPNQPFNFAVFSTQDSDIFLTAKNNIYKYNFKSKTSTAVVINTNSQNYYRILTNRFYSGTNYMTYRIPAMNLREGFFIKGYNHKTPIETLYFYKADRKLELITQNENSISSPSKKGNTITYTLSNFNLSPQIISWSNGKNKILKQSNKQQQNYYWGHSELLTYPGPNNSTLKGALFYPGNYNPNKKYPIIFEVYSEGSIYAKSYQPVTLENTVAFNPSVLTTKDYFVFRPDIKYEINYTGKSALAGVLAGVNAVEKIPGVDTSKMGLFGQSFGGFEVNYIATQTDKFKAIIASAGWSDLVDTYLTIDDVRRFNYFRFELSQIRIKEPFYSQVFLDNSPILQAHKITTPMLLIAGTSDRRVHWENSMKLQLALTKLGKESTLLLYKDEYHVMTNHKNSIDVNRKVLDWWDYHLKGAAKPYWN